MQICYSYFCRKLISACFAKKEKGKNNKKLQSPKRAVHLEEKEKQYSPYNIIFCEIWSVNGSLRQNFSLYIEPPPRQGEKENR